MIKHNNTYVFKFDPFREGAAPEMGGGCYVPFIAHRTFSKGVFSFEGMM